MEQSPNPGASGPGGTSQTGSADFTGSGTPQANSELLGFGEIRRRVGGTGQSRAKSAREARRAAQFAKFRLTELNLVPLVDTLVSIVFFALTTATVGELTQVVPGVTLPASRVGESAMHELTLGVGRDVTLAGQRLMSTSEAAGVASNDPHQPLLIPGLYAALSQKADSLRGAKGLPRDSAVTDKLAIQADRTMRYDLLARIMQSARLAGFRNISLQVNNTGTGAPAPASGRTT